MSTSVTWMPLHPLGTLGHGAVTHACPALVALTYACDIMDTCPQTHSQSSIAQCFYCHMISLSWMIAFYRSSSRQLVVMMQQFWCKCYAVCGLTPISRTRWGQENGPVPALRLCFLALCVCFTSCWLPPRQPNCYQISFR